MAKRTTKILYILPGYTETTRRKPYQDLARIARLKGYMVLYRDIDWTIPLSLQRFVVPHDAAIFGFSLGAVLARLVAQEFPCRLLIEASMTPLAAFKKGKDKKALTELLGTDFVEDAARMLKPRTKAKKTVSIRGALENGEGDVVVPDTGHELTARYISLIGKLL